VKQIEHDKATIVDWPPLNETQKRLRAVLDMWGPAGDGWISGIDFSTPMLRVCAINALSMIQNGGRVGQIQFCGAHSALREAATELGFTGIIACSDSGFENARKMVLRAIELAA